MIPLPKALTAVGFPLPHHCPLPSRRALAMPARCGCCPGRDPRRSPQGGSVGLAPAAPHPALPAPAHLRRETPHQPGPGTEGSPEPIPIPIPFPNDAREALRTGRFLSGRFWGKTKQGWSAQPAETTAPKPGEPRGHHSGPACPRRGSGLGAVAERKERFPSPHPKSQQLQGLMALMI